MVVSILILCLLHKLQKTNLYIYFTCTKHQNKILFAVYSGQTATIVGQEAVIFKNRSETCLSGYS